MGTVPVVPVFQAGTVVAGATGTNNMQALCTALTWCLTGRPLARLQQAVAQTFTTATYTAVTWDTKIVDRDTGWSSGSNTRYTAQTPGIYLVSANIAWASNSSNLRAQYFQVTTGSNNPYGAAVTIPFGFASLPAAGNSGTVSQALTPYLYVNDYLQVFAYQNSGGNLNSFVTGIEAMFFTIEHVSG